MLLLDFDFSRSVGSIYIQRGFFNFRVFFGGFKSTVLKIQNWTLRVTTKEIIRACEKGVGFVFNPTMFIHLF